MLFRPSHSLMAASLLISILSSCVGVRPPPLALEAQPVPVSTAMGSGVAVEAATVAPPTGPILLQPELRWKDVESTWQGTAYLVQEGERLFAVSSSHFLNTSGAALESVALWSVFGTSNAPLTGTTKSWGTPGHGGIGDPIYDLSNDRMLLPIDSLPPGVTVLRLDERIHPEIGERVWFPDKRDDKEPGHEFVGGAVEDFDSGFTLIRLDRPIIGGSQSGSPVVSQRDGSVIGTFSRGEWKGEKTERVWLTPALELRAALLDTKIESQPLSTLVPGGRPAASDKPVTLSFAWPDQTVLRVEKTKVRSESLKPLSVASLNYNLRGKKHSEGYTIRVQDYSGRGDALDPANAAALQEVPEYSFKVSLDGDFQQIEDLQAFYEKTLALVEKTKQGSEPATTATGRQDEFLRKALPPEMVVAFAEEYWNNIVGAYSSGELVPGETYRGEEERTVPLFGGIRTKSIMHFTLVEDVPCFEGDTARGCVEIDLLTSVDQKSLEQSMAQIFKFAELQTGKEIPDIHYDSYVQRNRVHLITHPTTLIPAYLRVDKQFRVRATVDGKVREQARWTLEEETFKLTAAP